MWTEGQTDITILIVAFRNFANAPKRHTYMLEGHMRQFFGEKISFYLLLILLFYFPDRFEFRHYRPYCNSNSCLWSNKPWKAALILRVLLHFWEKKL